MNLAEELRRIYFEEEWWHEQKLSNEDALLYHQTLLDKHRIITITDNLHVIGYVESWRINYEQLGRLVCHTPFAAVVEEVETGPIVYLANTWIHPQHRNGIVYKRLRNEFFKQNFTCEFFIGHALRKRTQPVKVFRRQEAFKKWIEKEEVISNGSI